MTVPKTSYPHFPLLLALLITSAVHFWVIMGVSMVSPKNAPQTNTIAVTFIKANPIAQLPRKKAVKQTASHSKAAENPTAKPVTHNTDAASKPEPKKQQSQKISAPQINKVEKPAMPVNKTAAEPVVDHSDELVVPSPEVIPAIPVTPAIVEPIVTAKVEPPPVETIAPAVSKPADVEKTVAAVDSVPIDSIDKPADFSVKTTKKSGKKVNKKSTRKASSGTETIQPALSMEDLAAQIAQVGEKFGNQAPSASESRIKPLDSVREHKTSARQYKQDWRAKIERIANLNFPGAARQKDFSARLVLEVGINADGSIHSLKIKKSSGTPALDEAAKNIVQMGAPFAALPKDLAEELDVLVLQQPMQFSDESGAIAQ